MNNKFVVWFKDVDREDGAIVGGKGANLGEMTKAGFPVPNGFIVTAQAYYFFLDETGLRPQIREALEKLDVSDSRALEKAAEHVQKIIIRSKFPKEISKPILDAYFKLDKGLFKHALVAVRSSATAEDLPGASFAGQQSTFLNVYGEANVIEKVKEAWASLFTARAIFYRQTNKFDHFKVGIAIPVQRMVESDKSGIMFSLDPVTNDKSKVVIEAIFGLGEMIVQGAVTPDHYEVDKKSDEITVKTVHTQEKTMYKKGPRNVEVNLSHEKGSKIKLTDSEILALADLSKKLEKHYYFPQDSEWAIEGKNVYIVQTRPVTTVGNDAKKAPTMKATGKKTVFLKGDPASPGIASGTVKILQSAKEIDKIIEGDVLVAEQTNPDFVPAMKKAVAIVTERGGRTSHAAIVSRELGIPAIVGTEGAMSKLKDSMIITVDGATGEIYKGDVMDGTISGSTAKLELLVKGDPASPGIASGVAKYLSSPKEIDKIVKGDVLVAEQTNPDYVPAMKKASAIVTERGGRTSHAAIVSRELGIPAVVGAEGAHKKIKDTTVVTVNGTTGEVFKGTSGTKAKGIEYVAYTDTGKLKTATNVYVNVAEPSRAEAVAKMNADGVGLLRAEFMIADIGTHPKKLIEDKKQKVFIDKLSEDLAVFCKAFAPRPVVYRATDFKTNEYRGLKGGAAFEPEEPNPMLGFRGAARYIADSRVFEMEIEAIKKVRNKMGYKNLHLMIPFVRNPKELADVKKLVSSWGLTRSSAFKLWLMVEIPTNVIRLEDFLDVGIDGVSVGSNDLTMLMLGTDRDNSEVAHDFSELDPTLLWAFEHVAKVCGKRGVTASMCGQAPSDYPDLVEKLVEWGYTSMSVNADALDHVRQTIYESEKKLVKKRT
jgi:pyruvate, water dikinase